MTEEKKLTGYPSIDKPWLKYYSEDALNAPLPKCTMYQYIWENNKDHLSDIALRYYGTKISYGQLFENIKKAANAFSSMGIRAGDIVTIMSMHTPETIYAIYGLNYIGAVANMVYMTLAEKEILYTIENTESKLLLVLDAALEKAEAIKADLHVPVVVLGVANSMSLPIKLGYYLRAKPKKHTYITWWDFLRQGASEAPKTADHAAPSVIVYTSGTTGEPKGAVLSNDALNAIAFQCIGSGKDYKRGDTFLNVLPPFLGFGIGMLHLAFSTGINSTLWVELTPEAIAKTFLKLRPNRFVTGPAFVTALIENISGDLSQLKEITGGGGALPVEVENELNLKLSQHRSSVKYTEGYGMTEFGSVVCMQQNRFLKQGSIGIPLPQTNVKAVSINSTDECTYCQVGELWFCTPSLMSGYYRNEQATKESIFIDDSGMRWFRTGDLGCVDEDGFVYIKGRIKRIYITRDKDGTAYKLFPQKIEELICRLDEIEACGVAVLEDHERMHVPVIFATPKTASRDRRVLEAQLWQHVIDELSEYEQPIAIHVLEDLPMTPSGKIDYRALEEMAKEM